MPWWGWAVTIIALGTFILALYLGLDDPGEQERSS
jgi:hypothetical protein